MAEQDKRSFIVFHEWLEPLEQLSDEDCGRLFKAMIEYSETGVIPSFDGAIGMAFAFIRPAMDRNAEKWSEERKQRSEAGRLGGIAKAKRRSVGEAKQSLAEPSEAKKAMASMAVHAHDLDSVPAHGPANDKADFQRFWEAYPRKVGKEAARKAFAKVKVDVSLLLHAIQEQQQSEQWSKDGGQYVPNPATWLNQGRWEDKLPGPAADRNRIRTPEEYLAGIEG